MRIHSVLTAFAALFAVAHAQLRNNATTWPEEVVDLCLSNDINGAQRFALNASRFVTCYKNQVFNVLDCPSGFLFDEDLQGCAPRDGVSWIPAANPNASPRNATPSIFLYVWAGTDNPGPDCRDAVVVLDATPESPTFGKIINITYTPTYGNEPHHVGLSNNSFLAVGGIQSYLNGNPDIYIFNVSNPTAPTLLTSVDPPLSAATDSFNAQPDGGFWISQMGDANGGTPGRMVRLFGNFSTAVELPRTPPSGFNPHGFAIDAARQRMVTADYLDLKSTITAASVKPQFLGSGTFQYRHSLRVWQLPNFTQPDADLKLVGEYVTGEADSKGFMTVQFVGSSGVAVSGGGLGVLYAINATNPADVRPALVTSYLSSSCVFIPLNFSSGTRFVGTSLGLNLIQLLDTSSPFSWRVIQELYLPNGTYPHAVTAARNGTLLAVSTYYLDQQYNGVDIGVLRQYGSAQVFFFDVVDGGNRIRFNSVVPVVQFRQAVNELRGNSTCGGWRPHGMVFRSLPATAPAPASAPASAPTAAQAIAG